VADSSSLIGRTQTRSPDPLTVSSSVPCLLISGYYPNDAEDTQGPGDGNVHLIFIKIRYQAEMRDHHGRPFRSPQPPVYTRQMHSSRERWIILSKRSDRDMPAARAARGKRLVSVMPGMVLVSNR